MTEHELGVDVLFETDPPVRVAVDLAAILAEANPNGLAWHAHAATPAPIGYSAAQTSNTDRVRELRHRQREAREQVRVERAS